MIIFNLAVSVNRSNIIIPIRMLLLEIWKFNTGQRFTYIIKNFNHYLNLLRSYGGFNIFEFQVFEFGFS